MRGEGGTCLAQLAESTLENNGWQISQAHRPHMQRWTFFIFYFRANFQSFFSVRQEAFLRVFFYVIFLPLCSLFIRSVIRYTVLGEDIIVKPLFFSPRHSDYQHFCSLLRRTYTLWSAWFLRYSNSTKIGIFLLQLFLANNCFLIPKCMWEGIVYLSCRNRSKRWDGGGDII